jgi:hypothetical protein
MTAAVLIWIWLCVRFDETAVVAHRSGLFDCAGGVIFAPAILNAHHCGGSAMY